MGLRGKGICAVTPLGLVQPKQNPGLWFHRVSMEWPTQGFPSQHRALLCHLLLPQAGVPTHLWGEGWSWPLTKPAEFPLFHQRRSQEEHKVSVLAQEPHGCFKQERVVSSAPGGEGHLLRMSRNLEVQRDWRELVLVIVEKGRVNLRDKHSKIGSMESLLEFGDLECTLETVGFVVLESVCCGNSAAVLTPRSGQRGSRELLMAGWVLPGKRQRPVEFKELAGVLRT